MKRSRWLVLVVGWLFLTACAAQGAGDPPPEIDPGVDADSWAFISAGEFYQGPHAHVTLVEADFEIMVTLVTNDQFVDFLNAAGQDGSIHFEDGLPFGDYPGDEFHAGRHEEEINAGDYLLAVLDDQSSRIISVDGVYAPRDGYANHPVTGVSWFGARAYCRYYNWRLPSEVEWEKAARGPDDRPFPWGDTLEPGNANYYSSHDIFEKLAGKSDTTPVGFYNGKQYDGFQTLVSASPYGLYDMAGNVWQWVGDVYPEQHYRYLRGGSKENYAYNLRVWTRNSAAPAYASPNVGFRCAKDV